MTAAQRYRLVVAQVREYRDDLLAHETADVEAADQMTRKWARDINTESEGWHSFVHHCMVRLSRDRLEDAIVEAGCEPQ